MSLQLVNYESSDDEPAAQGELLSDSDDESDSAADQAAAPVKPSAPAVRTSTLPTPDAMLSKVKGPPAFLLSAATAGIPGIPKWGSIRSERPEPTQGQAERAGAPQGAVLEAKAQLRLRDEPPNAGRVGPPQVETGGKRAFGAEMPPPGEAASMLRLCEQCGVPKTMSAAKGGMVCPLCKDQPPREDQRKRDGGVKDKEKMKRMKGQSAHASWKSETEMQLRQTFD